MNKKINKIAKKIGLLSDQNGIIKRYINENGGWDIHLNNCKQFITSHCDIKDNKVVYVLGSGWLLDVPIDFLVKKFEKVFLIDISHPKQITHKYRNRTNVFFIEKDITGNAIETIYDYANSQKEISEIKFKHFEFSEEPSFVISINILNQLDILLIDYLLKKRPNIPQDEILNLRKKIQQAHIDMLPTSKSIIISDVLEKHYNENNEKIESFPLVHINLPKSIINEKWEWNFDSLKTYHPKYKTIFNVIALHL